jgi:hypothetical protein
MFYCKSVGCSSRRAKRYGKVILKMILFSQYKYLQSLAMYLRSEQMRGALGHSVRHLRCWVHAGWVLVCRPMVTALQLAAALVGSAAVAVAFWWLAAARRAQQLPHRVERLRRQLAAAESELDVVVPSVPDGACTSDEKAAAAADVAGAAAELQEGVGGDVASESSVGHEVKDLVKPWVKDVISVTVGDTSAVRGDPALPEKVAGLINDAYGYHRVGVGEARSVLPDRRPCGKWKVVARGCA